MLTIPDLIEALQELGEDRRRMGFALLEAQRLIHREYCKQQCSFACIGAREALKQTEVKP